MLKRFFAGMLMLAAACGGGGGAALPGAVTINTQSLDQGNVGHSFLQQMQASGGKAPLAWWVSSTGDPLPAGLAMQPDGRIAGTPTQAVTASIVVVVQDSQLQLALVTLGLEVRDIQISGASGQSLVPGTSLALQASGGSPGYSFSMSANMSGAAVTAVGEYTAGNNSGVDVVRATDADGFFEDLSITVGDNPFVGFTAQFGSTDVWWINWDVVHDPAPTYATDLDETLVALGLRDPASTDALGTEADQLARLLVIRRTLGYLSTYYGNSFDGNTLPGGLAISFPAPQAPPGTLPSPGSVQGAAPGRFSSICTRWGPTPSVVGTAWLDPGNDSVENDCGDPAGTSLGIFVNRVLGPYLSGFNNSIAGSPVAAADVAGLTAMLSGAPPTNGRENAIFDVADDFGRVLGAVLAHEIGHSLGLGHSGSSGEPPSSGQGDVMNAALSVGASTVYAFNAGHWATLLTVLPGPNR